ncbi:MAG: FMN-binding negative transcriptional regulator [Cyclobacteriaceae bacterium]|nr:FMN-binding negative transcriptional regulator [Cyclobacteriaceae bacterium]
MYTPKNFRNENSDELKQFIRDNGFGILISQMEGKPWATHIPMILSEDGKTLTGHVARANFQWKNFDTASDVLAVFSGPHAYISSSWYDHENVPTWNYIAVHVTGKIRIIEDEALLQSLKDLVNKYEKDSACPVTVEKMTPKLLQADIKAIVAFEIQIEKMEASYKLSQNRDDKNYQQIIAELQRRNDTGSSEIAREMKKNRSVEKH